MMVYGKQLCIDDKSINSFLWIVAVATYIVILHKISMTFLFYKIWLAFINPIQ